MEKQTELITALILINRGGRFSTSDGLCRVLALFFRILNCSNIINELIRQGYMHAFKVDKTDTYSVTSIGQELINKKYKETIQKLLEIYPNEHEFINNM